MKRILFACLILAATCTASFAQNATPTLTKAGFTEKVNQMDAYIGQRQIESAKTSWEEVHKLMMAQFASIKVHAKAATTEAEYQKYVTLVKTEEEIYRTIWEMKTDLATNRNAIHAKLLEFAKYID
jgi:hypothetical protein